MPNIGLQEDGFLVISGFTVPFDYKYSPETDNVSGRSLSTMSTTAAAKMGDCPNCPYKEFEKFRSYYGMPDYADSWIRSAAERTITPYTEGVAEFVYTDDEGAYGTFFC